MKYRTGQRIRAIRELVGFTRDEFSVIAKIDRRRLETVEKLRVKANEDEFSQLGPMFPVLLPFLAYEASFTVESLLASPSNYERIISTKLEAGIQPRVFNISEFVK